MQGWDCVLGHLLEEILLTGFWGLSRGSHCPPGVTWSLALALAVMPEGFPAERASRMEALEIP